MACKALTADEKAICELYVLGYTVSYPQKVVDYACVGRMNRCMKHFNKLDYKKSHNVTDWFLKRATTKAYINEITELYPTKTEDVLVLLKSELVGDILNGGPTETIETVCGKKKTVVSKRNKKDLFDILIKLNTFQNEIITRNETEEEANKNSFNSWFNQESERQVARENDDLNQVIDLSEEEKKDANPTQ